jgi:type VI secretion system protein ImpC
MERDSRFEVNVGERPDGEPIADAGTFTIAILGDFSGRSSRGARHAAPLTQRRAHPVDRDEVDAVLASLAPRLELTIEGDQPPLALTFASLDDFHPDHIAERTALFQQLRALKREAASTGTAPAPRAPSSSAQRTNQAALNLGSGSLLDQIVDGAAGPANSGQRSGVASRDELTAFVANATRGHTVPDVGRDQQTLIDRVDGVITATMRVVLHFPAFQALESLWRGVDFLVRRFDSNDVRVVLVDVTRDELVAAAESGMPAWSLAVAAFSFGAGDIETLGRLAAAAERSRVPVIAAADASFARTPSFDGGADPDDWDTSSPPGWDELRSRTSARFLALTLPRFVLRLPYGKSTDACETMAFEEMPSPDHEAYLWGNPAVAAAALIAASVADGDDPPTQGVLDNLPLHVVKVNGEPTAKPAGEAWLTQPAVTLLLDRGLTPLETSRDGDSVRLPRIQSIAAPPRPLSFVDR